MQKNFANFNIGRLLEDIMGLAHLVKSEGKTRTTHELEKVLKKMNLATKSDLDAVRAIAVAARTQAEEVAEHVGLKKKAAKKTAAKPAVKKTPAKKPAPKAKKK